MIIFMGIAGSGKGTQSKLFAEKEGYEIISTGDLLRNYGSQEQHKRMLTGEILGDEEVTLLLDKALLELSDQDKVILDGYPRRISQAEWLLSQQKQGRFHITDVLHLVASREVVKSRLHDRARPDDHHEAIEERFSKYEEATLPILEYLTLNGVPVVDINAERSIPEVQAEILQVVRDTAL